MKRKLLIITFLAIGLFPAWGETNVHRLYWTIPTLCDSVPHEADSLLSIMYKQLEVQRQSLGEAHFLAYLSAANAYTLDLHPTQLLAGLRAMQLSRKALQLAPNDPLVMSIRAHIMFYAPSPLGDKRQALSLYTRACDIYDRNGIHDEVYPVCKLNIALCYRSLGDTITYKQLLEETLSEYPFLQ